MESNALHGMRPEIWIRSEIIEIIWGTARCLADQQAMVGKQAGQQAVRN